MTRTGQQGTLVEALQAYNHGVQLLKDDPNEAMNKFREARDGFQKVIDGGIENGKLLYNLGNAHLRLAEVGEAIAAYRQAERLIPSDEQLDKNLQFARSLRRDKIVASGEQTFVRTVFFLHYVLPLGTRVTLALAAYGLFWGLMIVRVVRPRYWTGYPALLCLLVWLSLGVSVAISWPAGDRAREGVLLADDVIVRKGNGDTYDPLFAQPLHEGVEFDVMEQRSGWVHIELPDGNQGWVRQRDTALF